MASRLEYRISDDAKARVEHAARLVGAQPGTFAREAALRRADEVLEEYARVTKVPSDFFDALWAELDAPAQPNTKLIAAAQRLSEHVTRD